MSENVRTALITAAAVLFGGLIAGGSSLATTIVNQNGENERMEHRLDEEARGVARVLFSRLTITSLESEAVLQDGFFAHFSQVFIAPVSAEDMKLITSRLSADEFLDVEHAVRATGTFLGLIKFEADQDLTRLNRRFVRALQIKMNLGRRALRGVADLPKTRR